MCIYEGNSKIELGFIIDTTYFLGDLKIGDGLIDGLIDGVSDGLIDLWIFEMCV